MGAEELKKSSFQYLKRPEDGRYVESIDFVSAWSESGIKEINPKAIVNHDLNKHNGGKYVCPVLNYTNDPTQAVSDLKLLGWWFVEEEVPAGYHKIPQDLNEGCGGQDVYLCYSKEGKNKITDISFYYRWTESDLLRSELKGWKVIPEDINNGAGGLYIYILYQTEGSETED